jgi:translocation protein SEC63
VWCACESRLSSSAPIHPTQPQPPQKTNLTPPPSPPKQKQTKKQTNTTQHNRNHRQVCHLLPRLEVNTEVLVEDEAEIAEGDLVTIKVHITRTNLGEGESAGPVHAPHFPGARKEGWWVVLAHAGKVIIAMERVENAARSFTHELKVFGPGMPLEAGHYRFDLMVKSDCYLGLDVAQKVEFDVIRASELPEYVPHPDDVELDNEPTLFESLAGNLEDDSDSDLEMEEEEDGEEGEEEERRNASKKDD